MSRFSITRRRLITAAAASAAGSVAFAQDRAKLPRIGFLHPASPQGDDWRVRAFVDGLRELGYIDGKNCRLDVRWGQGDLARLPSLAAELVALPVDVLVAASSPSVLAAKNATQAIPIVMPVSSDPVGEGLVASLARPGGNITGLSLMSTELGAKRIQLLKELFPKAGGPVAVLWNPAYTGMRARFEQARVAAPKVGLSIRSLEVRDARDLDAAFAAIDRERPDAVLLLVDPFTLGQRKRIVDFVAEKRVVAIYESSEFPEAGGLMSYGPSFKEQFRRAAYFVDKILKGAKPADLPIEEPSTFELVVNMRTAKALGLDIPSAILVQATRTID